MRELIKSRLMQYLMDNGAAPVCKSHLDKMVDHVMEGLPSPIVGKLSKGGGNQILTLSTRAVAGEVTFANPEEGVEALEAYFVPCQAEPS